MPLRFVDDAISAGADGIAITVPDQTIGPAISDAAAAAGYAVITIDAPLHGIRPEDETFAALYIENTPFADVANERTFAGWMRTGMAAVALALGLRALFGSFEPTWIPKTVASMFILAGIWVFWTAWHNARRTVKRLDLTARSSFALVEPGSCFAGSLFEIALSADRSYMLDDEERPVQIIYAGKAHPRDGVLRAELHRRLALPVAPLLFALVGLPLGIHSSRSGRGGGFALGLLRRDGEQDHGIAAKPCVLQRIGGIAGVFQGAVVAGNDGHNGFPAASATPACFVNNN